MRNRKLWPFGALGAAGGGVLYVVGRRSVRAVLADTGAVQSVPQFGVTVTGAALLVVLVVFVALSMRLAAALDLHRM